MATLPRQAAVWDESRNTSRTRLPSPTALGDALAALARLRQSDPALVAWVEDGHPAMTDAEHFARFGNSYRPSRPQRPRLPTAP